MPTTLMLTANSRRMTRTPAAFAGPALGGAGFGGLDIVTIGLGS
jgi:hypothetical protein